MWHMFKINKKDPKMTSLKFILNPFQTDPFIWLLDDGSIDLNAVMHNILKWSDTLQKSCSKCCKIFKKISDHFEILYIKWNILGHYTRDQVRSYKKNNFCYHKALKGQSKNYSEPREFFFFGRQVFKNHFSLLSKHLPASYHIETSPLICSAIQWTGFYMIGTSVMKEFSYSQRRMVDPVK